MSGSGGGVGDDDPGLADPASASASWMQEAMLIWWSPKMLAIWASTPGRSATHTRTVAFQARQLSQGEAPGVVEGIRLATPGR